MEWLLTVTHLCVLRIYLLIAAIFMCGDILITRSSDVKTDTIYYYMVPVRDAVDYRSVSLLENTILPQTALVTWNFTAKALSQACHHRDVIIHIQHGGYSLLDTDNKTYPANFYLHRTNVEELTISTSQSHRVISIVNPLYGNWFTAAYLAHINDGPLDCLYTLQLNVTSLMNTNIQQLRQNDVIDVTLQQKAVMFKIFSGDTTWKFTIAVVHCSVNGSQLEHCPIVMSVRSGALPSSNSDSITVNCTVNKCIVYAVRPFVQQWFYVKLDSLVNKIVTAQLMANTEVCGHNTHNDTVNNRTETTNNAPLPDCPPVYSLTRIENPNIRFSVQYSFGPSYEQALLALQNGVVTLMQFSVAPMKDTGGTLTLKTSLHMFSEPMREKIVLHICLQRGIIPFYNGDLQCASHDFMELTSWDSHSLVRHYPYPEPGPWFFGLQGWCLPLNESNIRKAQQCKQAAISFSLTTNSCMDLNCANTGKCYLARRGPYLLSTCKCQAGWRGYGCTDASNVRSLAWQLTYTLLLTLTNLAFIPAIILSIYRRYHVEALVYTANMVFSGVYHACDVNSWSIYHKCVLPYHMLSYFDFFTSILSFVVTLTVMAELSPTTTSLVHTVNIFFLIVAVQWEQHSLVTFLVPSVFCLVIVIVERSRRLCKKQWCDRREWCKVVPGVILAAIGMCLFAFAENYDNYPLVHSGWHVCMGLCIIFFLPYKNNPIKEENVSEFPLSDTCVSSDDASLLPADSLAAQSTDIKDDIIL